MSTVTEHTDHTDRADNSAARLSLGPACVYRVVHDQGSTTISGSRWSLKVSLCR